MTTIAWDGKTLAADCMLVQGRVPFAKVDKIVSFEFTDYGVKKNACVAGTGSAVTILYSIKAIKNLLLSGESKHITHEIWLSMIEEMPGLYTKDDEVGYRLLLVIFNPDGSNDVLCLSSTGDVDLVTGSYAIGVSWNEARACMMVGADAVKATAATHYLDPSCVGPVITAYSVSESDPSKLERHEYRAQDILKHNDSNASLYFP